MGFTNPETDLLTATAAWVTVVEIKLCSVLIKTPPRSCTRCRAPKNMTTHHCYRKDFHFYTNDLPRYFHLGGTVSSFSLYRYRASDTEWPSQSCYTSLEWQSHWSASYSQNPPAAIGNDHCLMETNLLHLLGWNKRERDLDLKNSLWSEHIWRCWLLEGSPAERSVILKKLEHIQEKYDCTFF